LEMEVAAADVDTQGWICGNRLTHHHPIPMAMPFSLNHKYQRNRYYVLL
jgi:hypothetical protein